MARLGRARPAPPIITRTRPPAAASGSGTITGATALAGSGVKHATGTAVITAVAGLSGAGAKGVTGTAILTAVTDLSGTGEKQSGIGSIPRPRVRWQFIVGPASGGYELSLTEARGRRFTAKLTEPSEIDCTLDGRHPQAAAVTELLTDLHVLWTSDAGQTAILGRCRVGTLGDDGDDTHHETQVTALDYRAILNRRRLYAGDTLVYTATDQAEIVAGLVASTQAHTAGDLGITKAWAGTTPTGVNRDRTYEAGDSVGERAQELSEVIDGFDWDVVPASPSALALSVWYPQRGVDRGVVLEAGGLVRSWRRDVSATDYANAIRYTGGQTDATPPVVTTPVELEAPDLASRLEGRWDAVYGDDGLIDQGTLNDRAAWQLDQAQVIRPVYTLTLVQDAWEGPDHIWLGDPVRVAIMSGRLAVNTVQRVYEMAFTLGENGEETLEVTTGGPKPDYRRRATLTEKRLRDLERR